MQFNFVPIMICDGGIAIGLLRRDCKWTWLTINISWKDPPWMLELGAFATDDDHNRWTFLSLEPKKSVFCGQKLRESLDKS